MNYNIFQEVVMMQERYKVIGGMLALGDFTSSDLAHFSGVSETTVRTILGRNRHLVEEIDREVTGKRGGQRIRYRLRTEQTQNVRSEIENLSRQLQWSRPRSAPSPKLPLGLLAAEDI